MKAVKTATSRVLAAACLVACAAAGLANTPEPPPDMVSSATTMAAASPAPAQAWAQLVDHYFDTVYLRFNPTAGTSAGLHAYDSRFEDYSRSGIDAQVAALHDFERKIAAFPAAGLDQPDQGDRAYLLGTIRSALLTLEVIRPWQRDPDFYSSAIANGAYTIMERDYAPAEVRLAALIERERSMPAVLAAARTNLKVPPRVFTTIALEQLPGIIALFKSDVPSAFSGVKDPRLLESFKTANAAVIDALVGYQRWVRTSLAPTSHGDFRIGAAAFSEKLKDDEMVDLPLDRLLEIAYQDLRRNQAAFRETARRLDPHKAPTQVLDELRDDHGPPDQLLHAFQGTFDNLIEFIRTRRIVTIPSDVRPILEETPPFMRATTFASMDTPGAYETGSKAAFFNVTVPEAGWPAARIRESMAAFNVGTVVSTAIHEAYPGHYVQFLYTPRLQSRVRKMLYAPSNVEGWAHYCEQMMLDEGYGRPGWGAKDERESKLILLGQLTDALLRDARFIVGIKMHTGRMTMDQAVQFFVREGYQSRAVGLVETKRGTNDPTYLYYTLGKLMILKLRADAQEREGAAFSLEKFHSRFLDQGGVPLPIVRKALLGDDSPVF